MATPTISLPLFPQHILQAEQIIGYGFCSCFSVQVSLPVVCRVLFLCKELKHRVKAPCRHQRDLSTFNELYGCCPHQWDPIVGFQRTNFCPGISLGCLRISTGPCQLTAQKEKWIKLRTILRHYLTDFLKLQRKECLKDAEEMAEEWSTMAAFAKDLDLVCTQQLPVVCNSSFRGCMPLLTLEAAYMVHIYIHIG